MPFGEYENFDDCLSKNSDKDDPSAYCGYIKNQVEEAIKRKEAREAISKAIEQDPNTNEPEGLTTPDAGNQNEEQVQNLEAPPGSSKEAENPQADGSGELSPTNPPQDEAEPKANPQDQARPTNVGHQNATEDTTEPESESEYGELNKEEYTGKEEDQKDEKRDEQQGLEYNGESYHKVNAIEFEDEIYTQKDDKEEAKEDDLEFEDKDYAKADDDVLELDDDFYKKDTEQAPMGDVGQDIGQPTPQTANIPDLTPTVESVVIRESNGKYRKYNVFEATEEGERPWTFGKTEKGDTVIAPTRDEPKEDKKEDKKEASDEIRAVEKIIIKEKGKLKFKSVFTEVKKKASKMTQ